MPALLRKDERLGEGVDVERWAVVRKIGDGGFAEVYEVRDTLSDDQRVRPKLGGCASCAAVTAWLSPAARAQLLMLMFVPAAAVCLED